MKYTTNEPSMHPTLTEGNAGIDLPYFGGLDEVIFQPLERKLLRTPWAFEIPYAHVGFICPRSGLANSQGLTVLNGPGIIDSSYRGELGIILINLSSEVQRIVQGERIAQLVILPHTTMLSLGPFTCVDELSSSRRGTQGFGSTGKL